MNRQKIVITEVMDAPAVESLSQRFDVVYDAQLFGDAARLMSVAADADAVIVRNRTQVRGEVLDAWKKVRVVGRLGVGLDNIDVPACESRSIRVIPATGANALAVAEYVVGTAMVLLRGAYRSNAGVLSGAWPRMALSNGREIFGKTLGLIGFGSIGQRTAKLATALSMKVVATDAVMPADAPAWKALGVERLELDALLAEADVVSLHVPLTPQTKGLLSAERIARMKPGAVFINTARGGIADEAALVAALRDGRLAGAAIDVFEPEPLTAGSVWVDCPNMILTPHIAGVTAEANTRVSTLIAAEVAQALG